MHLSKAPKKWLLDAAFLFCSAISGLDADLDKINYSSEGLRRFHRVLKDYIGTEEYTTLYIDAKACHEEVSSVRYSIEIDKYTIKISDDMSSKDLCEDMMITFGRYKSHAFDFQIATLPGINMGDVELMILNVLLQNYPAEFKALNTFCCKHPTFYCKAIESFLPELQFYLSCIDYFKSLSVKGYSFCIPLIDTNKKISLQGLYDISLTEDSKPTEIEPNDFNVMDNEKTFIILGSNRSGKTSYARALGQTIYLASLGLPVPCNKAVLPCFGGLYSHFAREEDLTNNFGRLKEELVRMRELMKTMHNNSLLILNDIFASTASSDAYEISEKVLETLYKLDCICIFVTNNNELGLFEHL